MIQLDYNPLTQLTDLKRDGGNIETSELLDTAVFISLFTNRLALPDDTLPDPHGHREGWWADTYPEAEGDRIGSRLWLLRRSKTTRANLNLAKVYAEEALRWLVDDGIAASVTVTVERATSKDYPELRSSGDMLAFKVEILRPTKPASRWNGVWLAHLEQL